MPTGRNPTQMHLQQKPSHRSYAAKQSTLTPSMSLALAQRRRSYSIEIVQHPVKTAEFGDTTLTRLPLAPPLIARLIISGVSDAEAVE